MSNQMDASTDVQDATDPQDLLDLGRLADSLGFLLRMAQLETFEAFHTHLGEHGLKPGEFSVIWLISHTPGVRQGVVARSLRIKQAHMTKLVRSLEQRGYVTRVIPDSDRRSVLLHLTDTAQGFVNRYQDDFFGYFFSENDPLTREELQDLTRLLRKFTGINHQLAGRRTS